MSTEITETEMSSDATPHTATARPVPGEPTLWSVTWLPGRALTRDPPGVEGARFRDEPREEGITEID